MKVKLLVIPLIASIVLVGLLLVVTGSPMLKFVYPDF
jgi:hypothetical protein